MRRQLFDIICVALLAFMIVLLYPKCARSESFKLVKLDELSLDYGRYLWHGRSPILWPEGQHERLNVNVNTTVAKYLFWDSTIESQMTEGQYRSVGLLMRVGVRLSSYVDVLYEHHSQHVLDEVQPFMPKFPCEDLVGVKIYLYRDKVEHPTIIR